MLNVVDVDENSINGTKRFQYASPKSQDYLANNYLNMHNNLRFLNNHLYFFFILQ